MWPHVFQVSGSMTLQWASHWWLHTLCGTVRWLAMTGNDMINNNKKRTKTLERESERGTERKERVGYCLLPTSFSRFASFFREWHQQPTQGASLFICPLLFHSTSSLRWSFPPCVRFPLMMELFVPLDVPSCTPHYSQSRTDLLHLWLTNFTVFFQDAAE